ncbi:cupin domain-containing protein [Pontibacter kalidii]|uniref:cupin domain-containing protein n=1 Tax=Pontibacter kalidii TaxID=2592049 RepID=UPI002252F161|nr:cupin domain-containing protein [Pontibacter kalidii]
MKNQTIDLKQVLGLVAEYDEDQQLISPDKPFIVKATFYPGAASNIHRHPYQDEYYKIHEGELELYLDGKWRTLKAGEEAHIPTNAVHGFKNTSSQPTYLTNIHTPGLNFGASLVAMAKLAKEGKVNGTKGFKNLFYLSQHALNYKDTILSVKPPEFVLNVMAKLGALLGYRI